MNVMNHILCAFVIFGTVKNVCDLVNLRGTRTYALLDITAIYYVSEDYQRDF